MIAIVFSLRDDNTSFPFAFIAVWNSSCALYALSSAFDNAFLFIPNGLRVLISSLKRNFLPRLKLIMGVMVLIPSNAILDMYGIVCV